MKKKYFNSIKDVLFILIFMAVSVCLLIRCKYGFGMTYMDELSQPAVVKRFFSGDRLLVDDWQPATTLIGYFIYMCLSFLPKFNFSVLHLRMAYVLFQVIIAILFIASEGKDKTSARLGAIAYLCSTPYGIMSICYNTVAIGAFLLFSSLFISEHKPVKDCFAGAILAIAVLANPYLIIVFVLYSIVTIALAIWKKNSSFFSAPKLLWLILGIAFIFLPFCIILFTNGSLSEYITNLKYIFNDKEHSGQGIIYKLFMSQYQILRVYWRVWIPMLIAVLVAWATRRQEKLRNWIFVFTCLCLMYGILRFAFIYGSVSINLMITPMLLWGIAIIVLLIIWRMNLKDYYYDIIMLVAGYLFAICNYLATNTEILSMSSMFIITAIATINIAVRFSEKNSEKNIYRFACLSVLTFLVSLFILRMTYIFGGQSVSGCNVLISKGIAKGIYTTADDAEEYERVNRIIELADISDNDKTLIVPINSIYYYMIDGQISSPYVFRFNTILSEIDIYLSVHPYKRPTKVLYIKNNIHMSDEIVDFFFRKGYILECESEDMMLLSAPNE